MGIPDLLQALALLDLEPEEHLPKMFLCLLKDKSCIFLPSAPGRLVWDLLVAMMIVYYLILVRARAAAAASSSASSSAS